MLVKQFYMNAERRAPRAMRTAPKLARIATDNYRYQCSQDKERARCQIVRGQNSLNTYSSNSIAKRSSGW